MPDPTYLTRDTYQQIAPAYAERRALYVEGLDELIDSFAGLLPAGALHLLIAEGETEGWEPAQMYGSDLPRWYTYHREDAMTAMLAQASFAITDVARWSSNRDWLRLRATRRVPDPEGGPPGVSRDPE